MNYTVDTDGFALIEPARSPEELEPLERVVAQWDGRYGKRNLLRDVPEISALARRLQPYVVPWLDDTAFPVRGLFFDKLPAANWEVGWHQDLSVAVAERRHTPGCTGWSVKQGVVHVQPPVEVLQRMLTLRWHLDDCGVDNGPLRVLRGSHAHGRLDDHAIETWKRKGQEVTCLLRRGGVLLMRPLLLHASSPAKNPGHRRVIHIEYAVGSLPGGLRWYAKSQTDVERSRF